MNEEPRYTRLLERARDQFPSDAQFQHWKRHYGAELDRGRYIHRTLEAFLPELQFQDARVLDIGCGDAGVPIAFAEAGAEAHGLEPAMINLRRGAVRAGDHQARVGLLAGVGEALPFPSTSFQVVILDNVLEHVTDRTRTLKEIHRVLVPDGILYMVTPKPFALLSLVSDPHYHTPGLVLLPRSWQKWIIERRFGPGSYQVGHIPTRRWLRRALKRHGFQSVVPPRDLWVRYLRERISRPGEIRPGIRRRVARWVLEREGVLEAPLVRWLLDVALGSNFFIARRLP